MVISLNQFNNSILRYFNIILVNHIYQPSAQAGYDTRSIFKWSLTGLDSEFSFFKTSCLTKAEEPSLPYYLPIAGWIHTFPKSISAM